MRLHDVDVFARHVVLSTVSGGQQLLQVLPLSASWPPVDRPRSTQLSSSTPGSPVGCSRCGTTRNRTSTDVLIEVESYIQPAQWWRVDARHRRAHAGEEHASCRTTVPTTTCSRCGGSPHATASRCPSSSRGTSDTPLDGTAPVLLYGYGAYESSFWPGFDVAIPSLLDRGVVFAHALIRGGGDMGRRWYVAGRLFTKRNTFTDFIDVADAARGAGSRRRLAHRLARALGRRTAAGCGLPHAT